MSASAKKGRAHVFIDTSVFLSFFAFTGDDIDQLKKVKQAIKDGRLKLHLPQQVVDEFNRNRESKIDEALEAFRKSRLENLPRLLATYPEAGQYQQATHNFQEARDQLVNAAKKDAEQKQLPADLLFAELCSSAGVYEPSGAVYERALRRHHLGNPPGEADAPLGDRLNWESLLVAVPKGADLHIVTKDADFASPLEKGRPNRFLVDEWAERKGGRLYLHPEVRIFLRQLLQFEFESLREEKKAAMAALENSGSFASTHAAIEQLLPMIDLLDAEDVIVLARAAVENTQIMWIAQDEDVREFYRRILPQHPGQMTRKLRASVTKLFGLEAARPPKAASGK